MAVNYSVKWCMQVCSHFYQIYFLSLYSLSKQLAEYADWENTGEASAGGAQGIVVLSTPHRAGAAGFTLGAPAVDRGGRILNYGGAYEENHCGLFFRCFLLLELIVFTIDFSRGIRWSSTRSFMNVRLFVVSWRCFLSLATCPLRVVAFCPSD